MYHRSEGGALPKQCDSDANLLKESYPQPNTLCMSFVR